MIDTQLLCKINGLHVTEVVIKIPVNAGPNMEAVYATLEKVEGQPIKTHGRCTAVPANWSKDTLQLLKDLLESMEQDLLPRHFKGAGMEDDHAKGIASGGHEEVDQV